MKKSVLLSLVVMFIAINSFGQTNTFPASGSVGIGTTTPSSILHIKKGDTPVIKFEQDNSAGWTPQTWDIAGNEANFFIRDVTGGASLPFRIQPGTPSSTLSLKSPGFVGINTWAPTAQLDVTGIIRIKNDASLIPDTGMIKYENGDFFGHDGTQWLSFTNIDMYAQLQLLQDRIDTLEARIDSCCAITLIKENGTVNDARLFQNNPNPYNNVTEIGFYIPQSIQNATLYIYDLSGKQVMKFPIYDRNIGSVIVNAGDLEPGMYLYSLILDGKFVDSKRMILTD